MPNIIAKPHANKTIGINTSTPITLDFIFEKIAYWDMRRHV